MPGQPIQVRAPVLVLMPISARWRPDERIGKIGDYALHKIADNGHIQMRFAIVPAVSLRWDHRENYYDPLETIDLHRQRFERAEKIPPNERRRRARAGRRGRRSALPVPMAQQWRVDVLATVDTPDDIRLRAAESVPLSPSLRVWRCPFWRRGADIWTFGR